MYIKYHNMERHNDPDSYQSLEVYIDKIRDHLLKYKHVNLELQPGDGTLYKIHIISIDSEEVLVCYKDHCEYINITNHVYPADLIQLSSNYVTQCLIADLLNHTFNTSKLDDFLRVKQYYNECKPNYGWDKNYEQRR